MKHRRQNARKQEPEEDFLMDQEQLQQLLSWLNEQIRQSKRVMSEAQQTHNYGREAMYEGMKEAYERCLGHISTRKG